MTLLTYLLKHVTNLLTQVYSYISISAVSKLVLSTSISDLLNQSGRKLIKYQMMPGSKHRQFTPEPQAEIAKLRFKTHLYSHGPITKVETPIKTWPSQSHKTISLDMHKFQIQHQSFNPCKLLRGFSQYYQQDHWIVRHKISLNTADKINNYLTYTNIHLTTCEQNFRLKTAAPLSSNNRELG